MRLFQNLGVYRSYRPRLVRLTKGSDSFRSAIDAFLEDRFGAVHILDPVLKRDEAAFFAVGDHEPLQQRWAQEQGLPASTPLDDILLAQIEHHRTEVFYNLDPMRYGDDFLARLPGSVRRTIAWRAAPSKGGSFFQHDLVVNNFPSLRAEYERQGAKTAPFYPGHDPAMDVYARNEDRPIDVLFVGSYSQYHQKRARVLEALAAQRTHYSIAMHLEVSRMVKLSETPAGWIGPLRKYRRPANIRAVGRRPIFGRELLTALGQAKIVVNGEIDMMGTDRGNMRIWEALGCGAAMLTDEGRYDDAMKPGEHFVTYSGVEDMLEKAKALLEEPAWRAKVARAGHTMIATQFSKAKQWEAFLNLAS